MKTASIPKHAVFLEAFIWLAGFIMLVWLAGSGSASHAWLPPCPFHALTGLDCPGCGSTRGLRALMHGQLRTAMDFNVLLIPGLLMLALGIGQRFSRRANALWQWVNKPKIVLVIVLGFWLLRNLPLQPFLWLSAAH